VDMLLGRRCVLKTGAAVLTQSHHGPVCRPVRALANPSRSILSASRAKASAWLTSLLLISVVDSSAAACRYSCDSSRNIANVLDTETPLPNAAHADNIAILVARRLETSVKGQGFGMPTRACASRNDSGAHTHLEAENPNRLPGLPVHPATSSTSVNVRLTEFDPMAVHLYDEVIEADQREEGDYGWTGEHAR
jgi:hypothetical protein